MNYRTEDRLLSIAFWGFAGLAVFSFYKFSKALYEFEYWTHETHREFLKIRNDLDSAAQKTFSER